MKTKIFKITTALALVTGLSLDVLGGIIAAGTLIMKPFNWNARGVGLHHAWIDPLGAGHNDKEIVYG